MRSAAWSAARRVATRAPGWQAAGRGETRSAERIASLPPRPPRKPSGRRCGGCWGGDGETGESPAWSTTCCSTAPPLPWTRRLAGGPGLGMLYMVLHVGAMCPRLNDFNSARTGILTVIHCPRRCPSVLAVLGSPGYVDP
uniref:Uncharacterized protein n=1 Tax=Oryza brachyantha TaxID=4533 RepID=J3N1Z0_ORYBR